MQKQKCFSVFGFTQLFERPCLSDMRQFGDCGSAVCLPCCLRCLDAFAFTERCLISVKVKLVYD